MPSRSGSKQHWSTACCWLLVRGLRLTPCFRVAVMRAGYYSAAGATACTSCDKGFEALTATSECTQCLAGTARTQGVTLFSASSQTGVSALCAACQPLATTGQYSTSSGSSVCHECANGSYKTSANAADDGCTPCSPGRFFATAAPFGSTCTACSVVIGTQPGAGGVEEINGNKNSGSTACVPCDEGFFASTGTAGVCTGCQSGRAKGAGDSLCQQCDKVRLPCIDRSTAVSRSSSARLAHPVPVVPCSVCRVNSPSNRCCLVPPRARTATSVPTST
jgi:hypothetical protein